MFVEFLFAKMLIYVVYLLRLARLSKPYIIAVERLITYSRVGLCLWPQHYRPIELIGRCLLEVLIGFYFAYPKRAQKLLVGRSQTLLIYFIFVLIMFVCGYSH